MAGVVDIGATLVHQRGSELGALHKFDARVVSVVVLEQLGDVTGHRGLSGLILVRGTNEASPVRNTGREVRVKVLVQGALSFDLLGGVWELAVGSDLLVRKESLVNVAEGVRVDVVFAVVKESIGFIRVCA